jgi:hypothetical protein
MLTSLFVRVEIKYIYGINPVGEFFSHFVLGPVSISLVQHFVKENGISRYDSPSLKVLIPDVVN